MKYNIFIFRRDLRIYDNIGLNYAMTNLENIIPIFIFTPEQITEKNKFKSDNAIQFMIESLKDLDQDLKKYNSKLHIFQGENIKVLNKIIKEKDIENIIFNMDYTPYAVKRDKQIKTLCKKKKINCLIYEDYLLAKNGMFLKKNLEPYTVFTPFKNNVLKHNVEKPNRNRPKNLVKVNIDTDKYIDYCINEDILVKGGRDNGLKQLNKVKNFKKYDKIRNMVGQETTQLSAYIKFGCISIREVYWKIRDELGKNSVLLSQLIWREFYFYIAFYYPFVLKGKNFIEKYNKIKWVQAKTNFNKWKEGKTGYPIVDAGMIELNTTGYMHNRSRLITSNFLNRMLGYHWKVGEKYFASQLTDYDPSVNNGNWQWIASTGVDPTPYFQRLFNPILQSKKYDPDAEYIKKWLPQLKNIPAKQLHNWEENYLFYNLKDLNYVKPIVEYKKAREKSIKMYRSVI